MQHLVQLTATDFEIKLEEGASEGASCAASLTHLVLNACRVEAPWLAAQSELRHLHLMALFHNVPLVSAEAQAFFAALGSLTRLTDLSLVGTSLAAVPPSTLQRLSGVSCLALDGTWTHDAELSPLPAMHGLADLTCSLACALRSVPALLQQQMPLLRRLDLICPRYVEDSLWRQQSLSGDVDRLWNCMSHRQPPLEVRFLRVSSLPMAVWKRVLQLQRECGCIVHAD